MYYILSSKQLIYCCFFNDTATTEIYTYLHTLSLHVALPISIVLATHDTHLLQRFRFPVMRLRDGQLVIERPAAEKGGAARSEEHTSELQSLMRISYAVFCLKKKKKQQKTESWNNNKKIITAHIHMHKNTPPNTTDRDE